MPITNRSQSHPRPGSDSQFQRIEKQPPHLVRHAKALCWESLRAQRLEMSEGHHDHGKESSGRIQAASSSTTGESAATATWTGGSFEKRWWWWWEGCGQGGGKGRGSALTIAPTPTSGPKQKERNT